MNTPPSAPRFRKRTQFTGIVLSASLLGTQCFAKSPNCFYGLDFLTNEAVNCPAPVNTCQYDTYNPSLEMCNTCDVGPVTSCTMSVTGYWSTMTAWTNGVCVGTICVPQGAGGGVQASVKVYGYYFSDTTYCSGSGNGGQ